MDRDREHDRQRDLGLEDRHGVIRVEDDVVPRRMLLLTLALVTVATVLLCGVAYLILAQRESVLRPSADFPEQRLPAPRERSNVHQEPFPMPTQDLPAAERARLEQARRDPRTGVVYPSIGQAMDRVAEETW